MDDLWLVHPSLPPYDEDIGSDRVTFQELGIRRNASLATILRRCERWWGERWPDPPRDGDDTLHKRLRLDDLDGYSYEETPRSIEDRLDSKEMIIYPTVLGLRNSLRLVSPRRAEV